MEESKSCLPVPEKGEGTGGNFYRFVRIIADLRSENGCPWDREQTHESIARNMIEEAHEAVAAIESGDTADLCEELGDVLLEVVLQAQIAADAGEFDIDDVIDGISDKMVRRHPHVYGDEASFSVLGLTNEEIEQINAVRTPGDVNYIWDVIKVHEKQSKAKAKQRAAAERGEELAPHGVLDDVARSLPALMQAQDISRKAVAYGFEWDTREDVWDKVREEAGEYEEAVASHLGSGSDEEGSSKAAMEEEFGDILFSLVNVARKDGIDAESALRRSCDKFRKRWSLMESYSRDEGKDLGSYGIDGLDELWERAKEELSGS